MILILHYNLMDNIWVSMSFLLAMKACPHELFSKGILWALCVNALKSEWMETIMEMTRVEAIAMNLIGVKSVLVID